MRDPVNLFLPLPFPHPTILLSPISARRLSSLPADWVCPTTVVLQPHIFLSIPPFLSLSLWCAHPPTDHQMLEFLKALSQHLLLPSSEISSMPTASITRAFTNLFSNTGLSPSSRPMYPNASKASTLGKFQRHPFGKPAPSFQLTESPYWKQQCTQLKR